MLASSCAPVSEPLRVVVLRRALQRLDRAVRGVDEAHNVGQQLRPKTESQPKDNDTAETIGDVEPLHSSVVFQHLERVPNHALLVKGLVQLLLETSHACRHLEGLGASLVEVNQAIKAW